MARQVSLMVAELAEVTVPAMAADMDLEVAEAEEAHRAAVVGTMVDMVMATEADKVCQSGM